SQAARCRRDAGRNPSPERTVMNRHGARSVIKEAAGFFLPRRGGHARAKRGGTAEEEPSFVLGRRRVFCFLDSYVRRGNGMKGAERICFIGAGAMAEAMLAGLLKNRRIDADRVSVFNRQRRDRLDKLKRTYGVRIPEDRGRAVLEADTVILAVKPKDVQEALTQWRDYFHKGQRIISVAA